MGARTSAAPSTTMGPSHARDGRCPNDPNPQLEGAGRGGDAAALGAAQNRHHEPAGERAGRRRAPAEVLRPVRHRVRAAGEGAGTHEPHRAAEGLPPRPDADAALAHGRGARHEPRSVAIRAVQRRRGGGLRLGPRGARHEIHDGHRGRRLLAVSALEARLCGRAAVCRRGRRGDGRDLRRQILSGGAPRQSSGGLRLKRGRRDAPRDRREDVLHRGHRREGALVGPGHGQGDGGPRLRAARRQPPRQEREAHRAPRLVSLPEEGLPLGESLLRAGGRGVRGVRSSTRRAPHRGGGEALARGAETHVAGHAAEPLSRERVPEDDVLAHEDPSRSQGERDPRSL